MRIFYFLLLFISYTVSAQIEVKIDDIISSDINPKKRIFEIKYHIKNLTDKKISFFLTPNTLIANSASSMTLFPVYKIYQNDSFEDVDGPFYEKIYSELDEIEELKTKEEKEKLFEEISKKYTLEYQNIISNYKNNGGTNTDEQWIYFNQKLLQSILVLEPNEIKDYTINTSWNKERYFNIDNYEYYLDENNKFEFELLLYLDKTNRQSRLSEEEYSKIIDDKNFIEGTFTSNKMEINFSE